MASQLFRGCHQERQLATPKFSSNHFSGYRFIWKMAVEPACVWDCVWLNTLTACDSSIRFQHLICFICTWQNSSEITPKWQLPYHCKTVPKGVTNGEILQNVTT